MDKINSISLLGEELRDIMNAGELVGPPDYSWNIQSFPNYIVEVIDKAKSSEDKCLLISEHVSLWSEILGWVERRWNDRVERSEASRVISYLIYYIDLSSAEKLQLFDVIKRMAGTSDSFQDFELTNHAVFGRQGFPLVKTKAAVSILRNSTDERVHRQAQRLIHEQHLHEHWVRDVIYALSQQPPLNEQCQRTLSFLRQDFSR